MLSFVRAYWKTPCFTLALAGLAVLTGCAGFFGLKYEEHLTDRFYLVAAEEKPEMNISYKLDNGDYVGVIEETVFAVGFNERFIIAKQHPRNDRKVTHYYILPVAPGMKEHNVRVLGPLTKEEFVIKSSRIGVPKDLSFFIVFPDLE